MVTGLSWALVLFFVGLQNFCFFVDDLQWAWERTHKVYIWLGKFLSWKFGKISKYRNGRSNYDAWIVKAKDGVRLRIFLSQKKTWKFSNYRNGTQSRRGGKSIGAARIGEKIHSFGKAKHLRSAKRGANVSHEKCKDNLIPCEIFTFSLFFGRANPCFSYQIECWRLKTETQIW